MPTIFLFCYRYFDVRLLFSSEIVQELAKRARVVMLVPEQYAEAIKSMAGDIAIIEAIRYPADTYDESTLRGPLRLRACGAVWQILRFVYASRDGRVNQTPAMHLLAYRRHMVGLFNQIRYFGIVGLAWIASRFRAVRKFLQSIYAWGAKNDAHAELFERYKPSLVAVTTFGMAADGRFVHEAKARGIDTSVLIQSWDKVSTKGYPLVHPDSAIVWSHVLADEADIFLEMPRDRIFVEGSPLWDPYFRPLNIQDREAFCRQRGLDPARRIVLFSLGPPGGHEPNLHCMRLLADAMRSRRFGANVQLHCRMHPLYFAAPRERAEVDAVGAEIAKVPNIVYTTPKVLDDSTGSLLAPSDFGQLVATLVHSDVIVSMISSQMIEAAFLDRPVVSIEYGRWRTDFLDIDIRHYKVEHLMRVYRAEAIHRVTNDDDLIAMIELCLQRPNELAEARKRLADREAPVNRGVAAKATAERLADLASNGLSRTQCTAAR